MKRAIFLLMLCPAAALASWTDEHANTMDWSHYDSQWQIAGNAREISMERVGFSVTEPYTDWFYSGLRIGYEELVIENDPETAGLHPNGGYLGVLVGSRLFDSEHFEINAQFGYTYHRLEDEEQDREFTGKWAVLDGRLSMAVKFWRLRFTAGAYREDTDGDQTFSGLATMTRPIEGVAGEEDGFFGGIDFYTDSNGGRIGINYQSGAREGYMLTFSREF